VRQSILQRFEELIDTGKGLSPAGNDIQWTARFHRWELSSLNILRRTFGKESDHYLGFKQYLTFGNRQAWIEYGTSCLESAKEEIEKGFLYRIEHLISADFFDSVLEHAEYLLSKRHKDPSAILGRVVIEKTLKQIADREAVAIPERPKLSKINELLWKGRVYDKIKWRLIQGYIDLGNYAAHGDFEKYKEDDVRDMLDWIRKSLVSL